MICVRIAGFVYGEIKGMMLPALFIEDTTSLGYDCFVLLQCKQTDPDTILFQTKMLLLLFRISSPQATPLQLLLS